MSENVRRNAVVRRLELPETVTLAWGAGGLELPHRPPRATPQNSPTEGHATVAVVPRPWGLA